MTEAIHLFAEAFDSERSASTARHAEPPSRWRARFDGSAHPDPGRCGVGALLTGAAGEKIGIAPPDGYGNSSAAEYPALLDAAAKSGAHGLTGYGDRRNAWRFAPAARTGTGARARSGGR